MAAHGGLADAQLPADGLHGLLLVVVPHHALPLAGGELFGDEGLEQSRRPVQLGAVGGDLLPVGAAHIPLHFVETQQPVAHAHPFLFTRIEQTFYF